jgi:hypothetical protein
MFAIGPDEEFPDGREWFDIEVVAPSYLAAQLAAGAPYFFTRGMLAIERWDPDRVVQAMQAMCDAVPEGDWSAVVEYLNRYTWYEYDGSQLKLIQRVPDAALTSRSEPEEAEE